ncbi:LysR family transcriptional regulator [Amycolatopsis minnesotensis]|uniref:LysR family transcriptional regulator n=1 Tax=Amycolatopsis minnesotensis TaxID=337894 RepID=A0ABN2QFB1_9PSEU
MEMLHLRYFVAVAEELNFSQAAKKLHMAASPLSQRIKDLEHELDQQLFNRSTHKVALTQAGEALLPLARDVLDRVSSIPWKVREAARPGRSTLFVGMPAGVHPALRERVKDLEERTRETAELKRWPGGTAELVADVRDGKLALALARLPVTDPALEVLPVMTERLGAAVPADLFPGRTSLTVADLTGLSYVADSADSTPVYFDELDGRLAAAGVKKRIKLSSSGYAGIAELVSTGIAFSISMLDPGSPMQLYRLDNVTILPLEDFEATLETGLVWRADRGGHGGDLEGLVSRAREVFADPLET